jgi:hypothetical protein
MGALIACVVAIGAGGVLGTTLGARSMRHLAGGAREQIARATVILLAGGAGALIGAQLDLFVRQLEATGLWVTSAQGGGGLAAALNTLAVSEAAHGVLLYGGALIGLATIVGLLGRREASAQRP